MPELLFLVALGIVIYGALRVLKGRPARVSSFRADNIPEAEETASPGVRWSITVHVAGESHLNQDGSCRQEIIGRCQEGERLMLIAEPDNLYDRNAIRVCRMNGEQVGYIERRWAARLKSCGETADDYDATIHAITGGTTEKPYRGVILSLEKRVAP